MKINQINLNVSTERSEFVARVSLTDGTNLIRADNTSGKSTLVQSIFFVLGLERSFGAKVDIPLPYAMRERIQKDKDSAPEPVLASSAELVIENESGRTVRLTRHIRGGIDPKLVRVEETHGSGKPYSRDYFLHDPGSAQREAGFHSFLADFLGLDLPTVPTYDGREALLYLECLLPLFFIEQKRGWSVLQGPFPTHLPIQDMSRRVMEFVLQLEVGENRKRRADIRRLSALEERSWDTVYKRLQGRLGALIRISGLPKRPTAGFAKSPTTSVEVFYEQEWISLGKARDVLIGLAENLRQKEVQPVENVAPILEKRLKTLSSNLQEQETLLIGLRNEHQAVASEHKAVTARLNALRTDLQKNKDAQKLVELGSQLVSVVEKHQCPTCHQAVSTELLPPTSSPTMSISENITFVSNQIKLYEALEEETADRIRRIETRHGALTERIRDGRREIRSLRSDLSRSSTAISRAEIEAVVRLETRIANWDAAAEDFAAEVSELQGIAARHSSLAADLKGIGSIQLTLNDRNKVRQLQRYMREYLADFHFASFKYDEVTISEDTLRPQVYVKDKDGELFEKDIGFDASASDAIRLKWAYYLAIVAVLRDHGGNGFGFLVIDEPGQQSINPDDLIKFINLSAEVSKNGSQIIISSSEDKAKIETDADLRNVNYINFDSYIISALT